MALNPHKKQIFDVCRPKLEIFYSILPESGRNESIRSLFSDLSKKPVRIDVLYLRLNLPVGTGSGFASMLSLEQVFELFKLGIQDSDEAAELGRIIDRHVNAIKEANNEDNSEGTRRNAPDSESHGQSSADDQAAEPSATVMAATSRLGAVWEPLPAGTCGRIAHNLTAIDPDVQLRIRNTPSLDAEEVCPYPSYDFALSPPTSMLARIQVRRDLP